MSISSAATTQACGRSGPPCSSSVACFLLGTALVTASMGFESVSGFDGRWCMVIIATLGTAYTVAGGMRAVIWTDVAQFAIFVLGYLAIGVVLLIHFQWQPVVIYETAASQISTLTGYPHTQLFSYELDLAVEATIWSILFVRLFEAVTFGSHQVRVQRLPCRGGLCRDMFIRAMVGSVACSLLFYAIVLPVSWGFVAFYARHPRTGVDGPCRPGASPFRRGAASGGPARPAHGGGPRVTDVPPLIRNSTR